MTFSQKVKKVIRRILRIVAITIGILLCLIILILLLIRTGPVQNYGRGKIEAYLENKLHTKVRIGNLYIDFPARIILKNIYLEDRRKDTLVSGGRIEVDISMLRLLSKEIRVDNFELENVTLKVKRLQPDTVFNFQFIADAFSTPPEKEPVQKDTSAGFKFIIGTIHLQQIHALYSDDASGNEVYVNLGDFKTKIKTFDPAHQTYSIPDISLSDISGNVRQYKPILILQHAADTISEHNKKSEPVKLELGDIDFAHINLDYRNEAQNMNAAIRLGNFHTKSDKIDLATLHIKLKQISLDSTAAELRFGKLAAVRKPEKPAGPKDTVAHAGAWSFDIASFTIDNTQVKYDDDNKAPLKKGIDYNHLNIKKLQVHTSSLHADPANYQAMIAGISFEEKSGLVLKKLSAGVQYGNTGASMKNLVIQTNYSSINNQTTFQYLNPDEMKKHPGDIGLNLEFNRSRIAVRDILVFVPSLEGPLKDNQLAVLQLNGKLTGRLKDIQIPFLEISGVGNTSLAASGHIKGLPDAKKAYYELTIARLNTSRTDIFRIVPARSMPDNLRIPEHIALNGKFTGTTKRFRVQLHTVTSSGNAEVSGTLDLDHKTYDLVAGTRAFDIGYLLKQDSLLGKITLDAKAKGSGFDPKKMNSDFHISLADAEFKTYHYKGLIMDAHVKDGTATL